MKTLFEQARAILEYNRKRSKLLAKIGEVETRSAEERKKLRAELEKLDREFSLENETR